MRAALRQTEPAVNRGEIQPGIFAASSRMAKPRVRAGTTLSGFRDVITAAVAPSSAVPSISSPPFVYYLRYLLSWVVHCLECRFCIKSALSCRKNACNENSVVFFSGVSLRCTKFQEICRASCRAGRRLSRRGRYDMAGLSDKDFWLICAPSSDDEPEIVRPLFSHHSLSI
jgi:hypothetical protein